MYDEHLHYVIISICRWFLVFPGCLVSSSPPPGQASGSGLGIILVGKRQHWDAGLEAWLHLPNQKAKEKGTYAQKKQVRACVRSKETCLWQSRGKLLAGKDTPPERRFLLGIDSVMVVSFINSRCVRVHTSYEMALRPEALSHSVTGLNLSGF